MPPLERDRELDAIAAAAAAAATGRGSAVLIEGPAGIGKSAVLDEGRRRAAGELRSLGARGGPLERDFAFGVVRQLLEVATARRDVPDAARAVLADPGGDAVEGSFAALHGLFWAVIDLAEERPLLLAVDDLQWADRASLRFIAYLARRIEELPVVLLATIRSGEPDVDEDLLNAVRHPPAIVLEPGPLTSAAVDTLLSERLGPADGAFVEAVHTATGGNPLLVRELAAALEAEGERPVSARAEAVRSVGPRAVSRTVGARLARMDPDAVATAQAVAVLGDGVTVAEAARLAGLEPERVAAATGPLARAQVLRPEPPLAFVHPLVADAVLQTLSPGERELRHAEAAAVLREAGASQEAVAGHLLRAPRAGESWVVDVLLGAAATAMQRGAPDTAATLLHRALEEPPPAEQRGALLLQLGLAEALSGGEGAVPHLRNALPVLEDPVQRGMAAAALVRTMLFTGDAEGATAVARQVAAELAGSHPDLRDQLEAFALMSVWFDHRAPEGIASTEHLRERVPPPGAGPGARMLAAVASFAWSHLPGPRDACAELAMAALAERTLIDADNGLLNIPPAGALAYAEHPDAVPHVEAALEEAHRRGSLFAAAGNRLWLGYFRYLRSDLREAVAMGRLAMEELETWGFDNGPDYGAAFLVMALLERGELTEARAVLDASREPATRAEGARHWQEARLQLLSAERRDGEALALADRVARDFAHARNPMSSTWRLVRAELRVRAGDEAGARADVAEQLALARTWGSPGPIGRTLRVAGELFGEDLEEAIAILEGSTMRLELAKALLALGRRHRLARRPTDARDPLRRALEIAVTCGATALTEEIRGELAAAGARPRTDVLSGPAALTPSERRVASLAADGMTNRDIAEQLFVTPKTIEVHLSAAYRKLNIGSRRELAGALAAA